MDSSQLPFSEADLFELLQKIEIADVKIEHVCGDCKSGENKYLVDGCWTIVVSISQGEWEDIVLIQKDDKSVDETFIRDHYRLIETYIPSYPVQREMYCLWGEAEEERRHA
ncbi:hypothetical protein COT97_00200 [Candidatus Falkowbacteria bacterium CG10_big_fil_rev_8_21_14_0_10_39_11]|uniref:Uncharacterized protein n=1 Tax=Candidatus Falkowbacteria bacterium CG10_big_fil_rev_8_21_14_0_10_39_11 TaxID=1974565 RepID=A0A2H0V6D5_9BACT|nr:MAG: hypothetical protein COT97_00200 [Candidatus Falkowbacteria bacterium CG10_big_fil_rev_8_21_14_0_10_39_11]